MHCTDYRLRHAVCFLVNEANSIKKAHTIEMMDRKSNSDGSSARPICRQLGASRQKRTLSVIQRKTGCITFPRSVNLPHTTLTGEEKAPRARAARGSVAEFVPKDTTPLSR